MRFLGDVDRIMVQLNITKPLLKPLVNPQHKFLWSMNMNQYVYIDSNNKKHFIHPGSEIVSDKKGLTKEWSTKNILEEMRKLKFPLQDSQPPNCYDYYHLDFPISIGAMILFRRWGASPISEKTLETIEGLHQFFLFVLTSFNARYSYYRPAASIFNWSLMGFKYELNLTDREFEVFILRLHGLTFKDIAKRLFISPPTVRKHMQTLLRKGNARNVVEMFTRRFLSELGDELPGMWKNTCEIGTEPDRPDSGRGGDIYIW